MVRSCNPAANTSAAATSSLAVLLVSLLTNLVAALVVIANRADRKGRCQKGPRTRRDRERPILHFGPQRPDIETTLRSSGKHVGSPRTGDQRLAVRQSENDHK